MERWIQISETSGRLITVIELLSPTNKLGEGRSQYLRRRRDFISARVNLVEIDLVRQGRHLLWRSLRHVPKWAQAPYLICVFRARQPDQREVYSFDLRDPLLPFRVPLRTEDDDVLLHLQPLVDRCFELGRYWVLNYSRPLQPALPQTDAAWVEQLLRDSGLARAPADLER